MVSLMRNRRDNKCYQMSWDQLHDLKDNIYNFADFLMNKAINTAPIIERPEKWYPVDTTE